MKPYVLMEFGELGVGEKHCITPNNVLTLGGKDFHMVMTVDDVNYSGMILDGINRSLECPNHHSVIYRFCPSAIPECQW